VFGKFLQQDGVAIHVNCVLFASGLSQTMEDSEGVHGFTPKHILAEVRRAARLICTYCKLKGAVGRNVSEMERSVF
jgi:hypothetical protein